MTNEEYLEKVKRVLAKTKARVGSQSDDSAISSSIGAAKDLADAIRMNPNLDNTEAAKVLEYVTFVISDELQHLAQDSPVVQVWTGIAVLYLNAAIDLLEI